MPNKGKAETVILSRPYKLVSSEIPGVANWVGAVKPRHRGKAFSL